MVFIEVSFIVFFIYICTQSSSPSTDQRLDQVGSETVVEQTSLLVIVSWEGLLDDLGLTGSGGSSGRWHRCVGDLLDCGLVTVLVGHVVHAEQLVVAVHVLVRSMDTVLLGSRWVLRILEEASNLLACVALVGSETGGLTQMKKDLWSATASSNSLILICIK